MKVPSVAITMSTLDFVPDFRVVHRATLMMTPVKVGCGLLLTMSDLMEEEVGKKL